MDNLDLLYSCSICQRYFEFEVNPELEKIMLDSYMLVCTECMLINQMAREDIKVIADKREYAERNNTGKPEMSYVDMNCLKPCAIVLTFGAKKYSRNNWKKGMPVSKILDSLMRHIGDLQDGKVLDEESKLAIIGHIQCNAMFLGNKNNEDDMCGGELYKE